ncbi:MAG: inositol monophosphatase, partial [Gammaproteobacteria bacterium]
GFWEVDLKSWDITAGIIIVKEAGGVVTDLAFNDHYLESGNIIAANPKMHQLIYQLINPFVTDNLK